jgi:translocator protein
MDTLKAQKHATRRLNLMYFLCWIVILQLVCYLMGQITQANLSTWYHPLIKSTLTPPSITFAIVWPVLYVLLAILGAMIFSKENQYSPKIKGLYLTQLILNCSWTPIFFYLHWVGTALFVLSSMVVITTALIIASYAKNKKIFFLLMPYLIWIIFATYLNAIIWLHI